MTKLKNEELLEELQCAFYDYVLKAKMKDYLKEFITTREQAYYQIKEMIRKSGVTEEWIQEKAENTASDYPDVAFPNLITIFKALLKEVGVRVG